MDLDTLSPILAFQSTPSAWRETPPPSGKTYTAEISIHSLRMEGDDNVLRQLHPVRHISIHSLRMEGDTKPYISRWTDAISIHSLRMEGDIVLLIPARTDTISIHSLRMEGD